MYFNMLTSVILQILSFKHFWKARIGSYRLCNYNSNNSYHGFAYLFCGLLLKTRYIGFR